VSGKCYLGDAVYLKDHESGGIELYLSNGILEYSNIVLEPAVLVSFLRALAKTHDPEKLKRIIEEAT